ncbi:MAG TPA: glycosyltransferase family 2 protein [Candidatus Limnocylindrales bacterium]|nr:glycosyltransferase family 2 protein [Candidatus Limnocylindrales bacterium]
MSKELISVVTPVYNETKNIPIFFKQLNEIADSLEHKLELIFVDDGSSDDSVAIIEGLKPKKVVVRLIELSRNFGKEVATTAGIEAAKGDAVIIIDSDLQHPIECIPEFIAKWKEGYEVVIGVRATHEHYNALKKYGSKTFYKIMNRISETKIVPHSTDYRLIDRKVVEAFKGFTERQRLTRGLIDWLGFKRGYVYFKTGKRIHGKPSYSTHKLIKLALNSFTAHSLFPLRLAGYIGLAFILIFGVLGLFTYIEVFLMGDPMGLNISGTALLAMLLLFAIGIVLCSLGLIALYIANIHGEVINRPLYVVRTHKEL